MCIRDWIESIRQEICGILEERGASMTSKDLYALKMDYLGKTGKISALSKGMREVAAEDRPEVGKLVGEVRQWAEDKFAGLEEEIGKRELSAKIASERIDVTTVSYTHLDVYKRQVLKGSDGGRDCCRECGLCGFFAPERS